MKNKIKFIYFFKRIKKNKSQISEFIKTYINNENKQNNEIFFEPPLFNNEKVIENQFASIAKDSNSNIFGIINVKLIKRNKKYFYLHSIFMKKNHRKRILTNNFYSYFLRKFLDDKSKRHSNADYLSARLDKNKFKRFKGAGHILFRNGFKFYKLKDLDEIYIWNKKIPLSYKL